MAAYPIGLAAAWISIPSNEVWRQFGIDPVSYFALRLADMLPENPLLLGLVLAIPLAGLYWLAERSFCEMEYPAASPQADGLRYLQRAS